MIIFMDMKDEQRGWLTKVIASTGIAPTTLATKAGLAPTTLTRFLNDPDHASALSARTISSVEKFTGIRFGGDPKTPVSRVGEAEPFDFSDRTEISQHVRAIVDETGSFAWTLNSRALETAGYQPGDVLIVDINAQPQPGDIVCAQIYDYNRMQAETVFRILEPPYLYSATFDRAQMAPILIDKNVGIKGPVLFSLRPRARSHAA